MSTERVVTWIFFEEGKETEPEFEIQADDYFKAFDLAYESYGPQVNDLYYKEKKNSPEDGVRKHE